jgi:chemotaxis protein histidine kinase CheA
MNFAPNDDDDDSESDFDCAPPAPPDEDGKIEPVSPKDAEDDDEADDDEEDAKKMDEAEGDEEEEDDEDDEDDDDEEDDEEDDDEEDPRETQASAKKAAASAASTVKNAASKEDQKPVAEEKKKEESKNTSEPGAGRGGADAKKVIAYFNRAFFTVDTSSIRRAYQDWILTVTSKERLADMVSSTTDVDKWPPAEDIDPFHIWVLTGEKDGKPCTNWYIRLQVHGLENDSDDKIVLRPIPKSVCKMLCMAWADAEKFPLMKGSRLLTHKSYIPTDFNGKIFSPASLGWPKIEHGKIVTFGFVPKSKKDGDGSSTSSKKPSKDASSKDVKQVGGKRKIDVAPMDDGDEDNDEDLDCGGGDDSSSSKKEKTGSKTAPSAPSTQPVADPPASDEDDDENTAPAKPSVKKTNPPSDPIAESAENPKKKSKKTPSLKNLSQNATVKSSTSSLMPALGKAAAVSAAAKTAAAAAATKDVSATATTANDKPNSSKKAEKSGSEKPEPMQVEETDDPVQAMLKSANLVPNANGTDMNLSNGKTASRIDTIICKNKHDSENEIKHSIPIWAKSFKMTIEFSSEVAK